MSDDTAISGQRNDNAGITLPNKNEATHNIGLSPLFITRAGRSNTLINQESIIWVGGNGYSWSSNNYSATSDNTHFLIVNNSEIQPSSYNTRTFGNPLRCLVSTNNG